MAARFTVIIGGGQAGLAMSRCLSDRGLPHVVLERGRLGERWRTERWDSLRLLTPNWLTRLPGFSYDGPDPDGFMAMADVARLLEEYAASFDAPVLTGTTVESVSLWSDGYRVETDRHVWLADSVVIATGYCDVPYRPAISARLAPEIAQLTPTEYRNPQSLAPGGVLVVGAAASGIQIADELRDAGRDVTIAVGQHLRVPRRYRGRDILWWLDALGLLNETADEVYDVEISRHQPSLQLIGRPDYRSIDLGALQARGVRLTGRLTGCEGTQVSFADDLIATTVASDVKLAGLLMAIDGFIDREGIAGEVGDPEPFEPLWPSVGFTPLELDLDADGITTVLWATGFRRQYPWLQLPVLDESGEIRQKAGVTPSDGLYVLGMPFHPRRNSAFIDGVGALACEIADRIAAPALSRYA